MNPVMKASSQGGFWDWPILDEMPRGRVVVKEAAELTVGTVESRAHGSDLSA